MNLNPKATKILCYGDSNTWGYIPATAERYPINVRWTGLLQKSLSEKCWIIEEGLNSRTTTFDDPKHEGKNGKTYLLPCLESINPVDIVILFLGTNDLKERFSRRLDQIASGVEELLKIIKDYAWDKNKNAPKIILISPTIVDETVPGVEEKYKGAEEKSKKLGKLYSEVADKYGCEFIDLAKHIRPSKKDGYHLDSDSHEKIAELLAERIRKMV